jgi:hypothetical protein
LLKPFSHPLKERSDLKSLGAFEHHPSPLNPIAQCALDLHLQLPALLVGEAAVLFRGDPLKHESLRHPQLHRAIVSYPFVDRSLGYFTTTQLPANERLRATSEVGTFNPPQDIKAVSNIGDDPR